MKNIELKLNIYDDEDNVVKTCTRDSYSIKMKLLKGIITMINFDDLAESLLERTEENDAALISVISKIVTSSYDMIQDLMKDIFKELTEEEFLNTHLDEIIDVVINLGKYSVGTIGILGRSEKN